MKLLSVLRGTCDIYNGIMKDKRKWKQSPLNLSFFVECGCYFLSKNDFMAHGSCQFPMNNNERRT